MASIFTPNVQLEEPARGDDVGVWDTPVNSNTSVLDLILGGNTIVSLNNSNVVLTPSQFRCATITFNSTLTGSVTITFPTSFTKPYTIQNLCSGSSTFTVTLATTAGGQVIASPPGQPFDMLNDGTNIKFKNFGPQIGGYWDYAGSSLPNWVSGCTVPPYLNADGTSFSSATYPALAVIMGGTTLPDLRGRLRAYLNQGTGRITTGTSLGGVDGNTLFAAGGAQTVVLSSQSLPAGALSEPSSGHTHTFSQTVWGSGQMATGAGATGQNQISGAVSVVPARTGITFGSSSPTNFSILQPMAMGGLTLIRAA